MANRWRSAEDKSLFHPPLFGLSRWLTDSATARVPSHPPGHVRSPHAGSAHGHPREALWAADGILARHHRDRGRFRRSLLRRQLIAPEGAAPGPGRLSGPQKLTCTTVVPPGNATYTEGAATPAAAGAAAGRRSAHPATRVAARRRFVLGNRDLVATWLRMRTGLRSLKRHTSSSSPPSDRMYACSVDSSRSPR